MASMWYYSSKNEQKGPVTYDELAGLAQSGRVRSTDLVWEEGSPDWIKASEATSSPKNPGTRPRLEGVANKELLPFKPDVKMLPAASPRRNWVSTAEPGSPCESRSTEK